MFRQEFVSEMQKRIALLAIETGYRACERGESLDAVLADFKRRLDAVMEPPLPRLTYTK